MRVALARREPLRRVVTLAVPAVLGWVLVSCDRRTDAASGAAEPPLQASEFACDGGRCVQRHVRLPDDGEWRCAESKGVAWCAGGEPAAGVVKAPAARGFVCGTRRRPRNGRTERVCVDEAPDYPAGERGSYHCRFLQERGTQRECVRQATEIRPPASRSAPDCWVDADCAPGACDRGRCMGSAR